MGTINLHTHTYLCRHGIGSPVDYCQKAQEAGNWSVIGFSEHSPFPDELLPKRMNFPELPNYCREVEEAAVAYPQFEIFKGLEIDYRPSLGKAFYEDVFLDKYHMDYLIGGTHFLERWDVASPFDHHNFTYQEVMKFFDLAIKMMQTGLIDELAHPDVPMLGTNDCRPEYEAVFRDIIACAKEYDVALEVNANGLVRFANPPKSNWRRYYYPVDKFWEMAMEANAKIMLGADAHTPQSLITHCDELKKYAAKLGLVDSSKVVVEKIRSRKLQNHK